ncbi:MAG: M3 family oligoendopeptidase [Anaerolineae bacterium]|nr:M3 family oligoendopeptidase [Anaerolineae bacterium]
MADSVQELTGAEQVFWDLSDLYTGSDDPAIERDLAAAKTQAEQFAAAYRGRVASLNANELADALREMETLQEHMGRIGTFASLQYSTDTLNPAFGALMQRVQEAGAELQQILLFFELEWATADDDQANITADPALARWRHYLESARRYRPHLLSEAEEKILTEKAVTGRNAWQRFFTEVVSGIEYDLDGKKVPQAIALRQLYSPDREARIRAADSVTAGLRTELKTTTFIFNTLLADKASNDKLRKYPTWISSRNMDNEISDEAVEALVSAVTSRYDIVARYYTIKRRLLGVDELFDYDRYAPLSDSDSRYTWDAARDVVLDAFSKFHPTMAEIAGEFFDRRWIHAPVVKGKRGGAFASPSVPSHHPYVLVNYTGAGRDVATLAHELGHGIHMYLSRPKGALEAYTPLTTAEMASVFGEMLVFDDMMAREPDPAVRMSMLAGKIEDAFATVFRQISMNRFEHAIHATRRTQGELTTEQLNAHWMETQRQMFQDSVTLRDDYGIWWSYVSHFLAVPGYVYAYAFGELLVLALFNQYKREGAAFAPRYLDVLAQGGSDKPENILARVGVDLTDPNFWQEGLRAVEDMVNRLEALATEAGR